MGPRRELAIFGAILALGIGAFLHESLFLGKVLSPGDVVLVSRAFGGSGTTAYEPVNRLLMDPVLQFQPWLEFTRAELRAGRLPLWNPWVGCGAPHLANGQSAVFDPFQVIAYVGTLPDAYAWMAAARLWTSGIGMFLLARLLSFGGWGRWFCGLVYPFCGFMMLWLLYPVAPVAVWLPWLVWVSERLLRERRPRRVVAVGIVICLSIFAGHIQTAFHVGLWCLVYVAWRTAGNRDRREGVKAFGAWGGGVVLGLLLAAAMILPLGVYLSRSPVWEDRKTEHGAWWTPPRVRALEAATTAIPYALGSQRNGHPNLAKAMGAENVNESAGGFAGLATLVCLAPLAFRHGANRSEIRFIGGMTLIGFLTAFRVPPIINLVRLAPLFDVIDHRRLTLWVAFGLILLGGRGLDGIATGARFSRGWRIAWVVAGASCCAIGIGTTALAPWIRSAAREWAIGHAMGPSATQFEWHIDRVISALPSVYAVAGLMLLVLACATNWLNRGRITVRGWRICVCTLVCADLVWFGYGLNPAIGRRLDRPDSDVVAFLRSRLSAEQRVLAIGDELPPNTLMRYGIADVRNYDSIELSRSVAWFDSLYEPEPGRGARSSRREITWDGVARAIDPLRLAGVGAIVSADPPPVGMFAEVRRVCGVSIALTGVKSAGYVRESPGKIRIDRTHNSGDVAWVPETFDPGWTARSANGPIPVEAYHGAFLSVRIPNSSQSIVLQYDPPEVRLGLGISGLGVLISGVLMLWDTRWCKRALDRLRNAKRSYENQLIERCSAVTAA